MITTALYWNKTTHAGTQDVEGHSATSYCCYSCQKAQEITVSLTSTAGKTGHPYVQERKMNPVSQLAQRSTSKGSKTLHSPNLKI